MSKDRKDKAKARADAWTFEMATGKATHEPTGIVYRLLPLWGSNTEPDLDHLVRLQAEGVDQVGHCELPAGTIDRRQAGQIGPDDANAPGVTHWAVLASRDGIRAALGHLTTEHGAAQALEMVQRVSREAGERWVFRARLERSWTNGNRAV
ncbi:MAG: hypothetical protein V4718_04590 [Pseudomonadota bacterium]